MLAVQASTNGNHCVHLHMFLCSCSCTCCWLETRV